jgi:hypothetical protein
VLGRSPGISSGVEVAWTGGDEYCYGESTSPSVSGSIADGIHECAKAVALEFGTLPIMIVPEALRADLWLYAHCSKQSPSRPR